MTAHSSCDTLIEQLDRLAVVSNSRTHAMDVRDSSAQAKSQDNHVARETHGNTTGCIDVEIKGAFKAIEPESQREDCPEGGREAYLCVFGSFCGCMVALSLMNSLSVFQNYIASHQLAGMSESSIGWIFGLYSFCSFFCGIQVGPLFDVLGPRWLVAIGSLLILSTYFVLAFCVQYWHFILCFSIAGGLGTSLLFTSSIAAISHWFMKMRGRWTGLACAGGAVSGVIIPLVLDDLLPKIGWAWSTRILGFMNLLLAICANMFIRARPSTSASSMSILPDVGIFRDRTLILATVAIFFVDWALFIPLGYLTSYAVSTGIDKSLSYKLIAILNTGSVLGRYIPGLVADQLGRFNTMIIAIATCLVSVFGLWLPADGNVILTILFALIFGFGSGSGISLVPVCIGQLCKTENYGRYYASCCTVMSFATLTGFPVAGAIVGACGGRYTGLIIFTGLSYLVSMIFFVCARASRVGWTLNAKF